MSVFENTEQIITLTSKHDGKPILVDLSKLHYIKQTLANLKNFSILSLSINSPIEVTESYEKLKELIFTKQLKSNSFLFIEAKSVDNDVNVNGVGLKSPILINTKLVSACKDELGTHSTIFFDHQTKYSLLVDRSPEQIQKLVMSAKKKTVIMETL